MFVVKKNASQKLEEPGTKDLPRVRRTRSKHFDDSVDFTSSSADVISVNGRSQTDTQQRLKQAHKEWNPSKRWNPFNSYKLLAQVERWKKIKRGRPLPPPVLITVDPSNICNLNCIWCNAELVRREWKSSLSEKALFEIADFLPYWSQGKVQIAKSRESRRFVLRAVESRY